MSALTVNPQNQSHTRKVSAGCGACLHDLGGLETYKHGPSVNGGKICNGAQSVFKPAKDWPAPKNRGENPNNFIPVTKK